MTDLLIRNVEIEGAHGIDVAIRAGRISAIGPGLKGRGDALDGKGGALLPGLADHHIHLLATAARSCSCRLDDVVGMDVLRDRIVAATARLAPGTWLRATGLAPHLADQLHSDLLGNWAPDHPVRIQDQSGGLWILNPRALASLDWTTVADGVEKSEAGQPTGRLWRADAWLRAALGPSAAPPLASLGQSLAACGVTALTDASVTNDMASAQILGDAVRSGALPQRLAVMSAGPLAAPEDGAFCVGPVKLLLDERDLPPVEDLAAMIGAAREQGRNVAVHCVTAPELAVIVAAFDLVGARYGDRIEHGGIIPAEVIDTLRNLRLTVVTQPGFIEARGERYLRDVEPRELADLYRCASLIAEGVPTAFSSDAPYGPSDPWLAIRAATTRRTAVGRPIGLNERISPSDALQRYLGRPDDPGGPQRRVKVGEVADLCLLHEPLPEALRRPASALVHATIVGGRAVYRA